MGVPVLRLLFRPKTRPVIADLRTALGDHPALSISTEFSAGTQQFGSASDAAVELLLAGLTFDVLWSEQWLAEHGASFDALELRLGPHLAGGEGITEIMRGWMQCGCILGALFPAVTGFQWSEAQTVVEPDAFRAGIEGWLGKGIFPARVLVGYAVSMDGAIQSRGLAHFTGQELRIEPPLPGGSEDAMRLAAVLTGHLALLGRLDEVQVMTAPDGAPLRMEPSPNGRFVRVWRG